MGRRIMPSMHGKNNASQNPSYREEKHTNRIMLEEG